MRGLENRDLKYRLEGPPESSHPSMSYHFPPFLNVSIFTLNPVGLLPTPRLFPNSTSQLGRQSLISSPNFSLPYTHLSLHQVVLHLLSKILQPREGWWIEGSPIIITVYHDRRWNCWFHLSRVTDRNTWCINHPRSRASIYAPTRPGASWGHSSHCTQARRLNCRTGSLLFHCNEGICNPGA